MQKSLDNISEAGMMCYIVTLSVSFHISNKNLKLYRTYAEMSKTNLHPTLIMKLLSSIFINLQTQ